MGRLLDAMEAAGIEAVVLKGAALAGLLYENIALRPCSDLDLLTPLAQAEDAVRLLHGLGYQPKVPELFPDAEKLLSMHAVLARDGGLPITVELHWSLVSSPNDRRSPSVGWFLSHTQSAALPCCAARILMPEANLLHLCAHLTLQHGGPRARLIWYCDVDRLVRQYDDGMDWDMVMRQAAAFHWSAPVHLVLSNCARMFETPVPSAVLQSLAADAAKTPTMHSILFRLRTFPHQTKVLSGIATVLGLSSRRAAWQVLVRMVFPTRAYMVWRYTPERPQLWPLTYPYRWWLILQGIWRRVGD